MEAELSLTDTCADWISKLVSRDGSYNDLSALLDFKTGPSRLTASGTREIDYPSVLFHAGGEVEVYKSFSLPPDLVEKFAGMQRNCLMGIFTLCERAWVAIDNELFMWNYEDGEDLAYYDGIQDTIISVGLATPREGVLPKSVAHLLCIATPLELVLLGMTYTCPEQDIGPSRDSPLLQVIPDPLYCISTDNYSISSIEATDHGRIFLGTKDGFMLEFCYGRIPGWDFDSTLLPVTTLANRRGPCTLVNHSASALSLMLPSILTASFRNTDPIVQMASDAVRRLVYTRTEESSLSVFSYPSGSERPTSGLVPSPASLNRLACVTIGEITSAAASVVRSVDRCQFKSLVSIIPLSSGPHHLLAVTRTGIRLYFDERLRLLHVRLPPASPYGTVGLSDVRLVAETRGTVVMVCTLPPPTTSTTTNATASLTANTSSWFRSTQLTDGRPASTPSGLPASPAPSVVYTISPDPFPWTPNLTEVCTSSWCVSGAWALTVLPSPSSWWAEGAGGNRLLVEDDAALRRQRTASAQSAGSTASLTTSFLVGDLSGKAHVTQDGQAPPTTARGRAPVVLTQHLEPPFRRLLLISAQGLVHLRLPNPLYRLKEFILGRKQIHLNSPGTLPLVEANSTTGPHRQVSSASLREFSLTQSGDQQPSFGMLDNNRFLTSYLHQFSPDEAICATLALGAEAVVWNPGLKAPSELDSAVEQVVLFFAAEAAQNWLPAVKCWSDCFGQSLLLGSAPPSSTPSLQRLSEKTASGVNSSIFLFTGLCVFVARMSRAFWHTPLFRDGTDELAKLAATGGPTVPEKGIGSWVRTFVSVLASAATSAASPLKGKEEVISNGVEAESSRPLISRFESHELFWLWHQLAYAQRFLRRHLRDSGGWLHADHSQTFLATATAATVSVSSSVAVALHRLADATDGLLSSMLELIGFWRILSEHGLDVHRIIRRLTGDQCYLLLHLPFEAYLSEFYTTASSSHLTGSGDSHYQPAHGLFSPPSSTGAPASGGKTGASDLLTSLVNALVDHYLCREEEDEQQQLLSAIGDVATAVEGASAFGRTPASVGLASITIRLLEACPTLFAKEDAISAKASECLVQVGILRAHLLSTGPPVMDSTTASGLCSGGDEEEAILDEIDRLATKSVQLYTEAGPGLDLITAVHRLISSGVWRGAVLLCLRIASLRDPTDVAVECLKHGRRPSAEKSVLLADRSALGGGGAAGGFRRNLCVSELAATEARYAAYYQMVVCLEQLWEFCQMPPTSGRLSVGDFDQAPPALSSQAHGSCMPRRLAVTYLSPSSARSLMRTIIQEVIIASNDILAHFEVINWLLARGLTDTAVSLNSPHMEGYLRSRLRQAPDDPDLRCLLWRQLERRGARIEAAKVLEHLAVTPCSRLTLEDRLNFAARAIVVVKSLPASQLDMDYLHDMESRLELAQLQQQLHTELNLRLTSTNGQSLTRCPSPIGLQRQLEEAVHQLGHGPLLSPTEMFTQYADRFGLHESKLSLLWVSDSQDVALIKAVWRDLLQSILSTPSTSPSPSSLSRGRSRSPIFSPRTPLSGLNDQRSPSPGNVRRHGNTSGHRLVELSLVDCLSRLGHRFCPDATAMVAASPQAQLFFPLGEIVATLERYAIQQSLPASWVPRILRDTRLPCCTAFASDAYDTLLHSKEAFWRLPEVRTRLLSAFVTVAEEFLLMVSSDRQSRLLRPAQTSGRLLDQVTGILVDLNSSALMTRVEVDKEDGDESMVRRQPSGAETKSLPLLVTRLRRLHDQLKRYC